MPLNYSKWDKLELSDDSDIEGHPNVDKRSLIRWKQRDIHERREQRKHQIAELTEELKTSHILLPRIETLISAVSTNGPKEFSTLVERLKTQSSPEGPTPPPGVGGPQPPSYDAMMEQLLFKIWEDVRKDEVDLKDEPKLEKALLKELRGHEQKLKARVKECEEEIDKLEKEQHAKITSDDIHEGFDSKYVPHKVDEVEIAPSAPPPKHKKVKKTETTFETLNTPAPKPAEPVPATPAAPVKEEKSGYEADTPGDADADGDADEEDDEDEDEDDALPTLTPALLQFSRIPIGGYDKSFAFLQSNRSILAPGTMDALFMAAYTAEMRGETGYARGCVHQALLLQYCEKLGKDGIALFFQRMASGNPKAQAVFMKDVDDTYALMKQRVAANKASASEGRETIQLQVENGVSSISFNIPDGPPPPADKPLEVSFDGVAEDERPNVEEVRAWLKKRWEIWLGFPKKLRKALEEKSLDKVNKVLEGMEVEEAEKVVQLLQEGGILNFSEEGIRDETGKGREAAAEAEKKA